MSNSLPASLAGAVDLSSLAAKHQAPARGAQANGGQAGDGVGVVVTVTDADFAQVVELSKTVPVLIDIRSDRSEASAELTPMLERLVTARGGAVVLAKVDADASPQIAQALQAQTVPTVAAIIGGRPVPLFTGALPEDELVQVLDQVLEFAASQGVTGSVPSGEAADGAEPEAEPELSPLHQEAFDAINAGDYATAIAAYEKSIAQNPGDDLGVAGLAQVRLLQRLDGTSADALRAAAAAAAAAAPDGLEAQLAVADLDISGGHVEDALLRALELVPKVFGDEREAVRKRIVEYFEIIGGDDERVVKARRQLMTLLY